MSPKTLQVYCYEAKSVTKLRADTKALDGAGDSRDLRLPTTQVCENYAFVNLFPCGVTRNTTNSRVFEPGAATFVWGERASIFVNRDPSEPLGFLRYPTPQPTTLPIAPRNHLRCRSVRRSHSHSS